MRGYKRPFALALVGVLMAFEAHAFTVIRPNDVAVASRHRQRCLPRLSSAASTVTGSFIETELRGAAMRLHTKEQAPKEGQAPAEKREPYTPTHEDYLRFLVDSKHVYEALEEIVNTRPELAAFQNSGLERVHPLEADINFMIKEYSLKMPQVGQAGRDYADMLRKIESIPEFICHYYNFYFAHTAGGRMIGEKMSALLLNKRTLEFYKWDGDLNDIKGRVKAKIEEMAAQWSPEEKRECVDATAAAFMGGGGINAYLSGGRSPH